MSNSQSASASCIRGCSKNIEKAFWQLWQQNRDYLYRCCIKWMGGNPTDAEDALSRAMLKAWEKVQKYAGEITNFKPWLTKLTHNLCVDIHRERSRDANRVEDIECYASSKEQGLVSFEDTPLSAMETDEKRIVIRRAIDNLLTRLRETFILHFYQELSYQDIAQLQEISYQNVCKRISQARAILKEELRGYFIGKDGTDLSVTPTKAVTQSVIREMSQGNGGVEPIVGETVKLSVRVEEMESVVGEESIEVVRSVQHSGSACVAATSEGKVEGKRDGCRCVEAALFDQLPTAITLVLAQIDETGSWGSSVWRYRGCNNSIATLKNLLLAFLVDGTPIVLFPSWRSPHHCNNWMLPFLQSYFRCAIVQLPLTQKLILPRCPRALSYSCQLRTLLAGSGFLHSQAEMGEGIGVRYNLPFSIFHIRGTTPIFFNTKLTKRTSS